MFCPKCGTSEQSPESFCRNCGVWLVDPDSISKNGLFRKSTREEKIQKMRTLELISICLSLTSATIIFTFLFGSLDRDLLFLAMACGLVVAVYQAINMYLGNKITKDLPRQRAADLTRADQTPVLEFSAHTAHQLNVPATVVEDTTDLLEPVPASKRRNSR